MTDDLVLVEAADGIATVTMNRPESRNALNGELIAELSRRMHSFADDDSIDVVILTGSDPAFCAGLDLAYLSWRADRRDERPIDERADEEDFFPDVPVPRLPQLVIGAVNGAAVTGGLELALACDLLVASDRARFADTHSRVGVVPGWGLSVELPAAIGLRRAKEMSATGNFVDAGTALQWGLVNHVVPHDELLGFARSLAADAVSTDRATRRNLFATYREQADLLDAPRREIEHARYLEWQDAAEGTGAAITERRSSIIERGRSQQQ